MLHRSCDVLHCHTTLEKKYEKAYQRGKNLNKQLTTITCGFPFGLLSIEVKSVGVGYGVFPHTLLHLGKGLTPVLPHLSYTRYTHIPSLTLLSSGREMDSYCLPEYTNYLWMWFSFPLIFFFHPVPHVCPFVSIRKTPCPPGKATKHIPERYDQKWLEIPVRLIFYLTTWIRFKSETHDGPKVFKTNHSLPWNPQEKGMFMKFLHNWHTHTHTHSESVRGCSIKY